VSRHTILSTEKHEYTDPDTGRRAAIYLFPDSECTGLHCHQDEFDPHHDLVHFISNCSGPFQIWRLELDADLVELGE
jgi:hypothetical protein